ncbi:hypothetical protein, partial [Propionibacterium australiense]
MDDRAPLTVQPSTPQAMGRSARFSLVASLYSTQNWSDIGFSDSGYWLVLGCCPVLLSPFGVDLVGGPVVNGRVETF